MNLLSSNLLSRNVRIYIRRIIFLPIILYGFEIWSLKLRGEYSFRDFENNLLKKISGPKWDEVPT
jgi:hypothetical protein